MAIGLSPQYTSNVSLDGLTAAQFLVVALETVKKLGWDIGIIHPEAFVAYTNSQESEEYMVSIKPETVLLKSESMNHGLTDHGKNKENVERFWATFQEIKPTFTPDELAQKYEELQPTFSVPNPVLSKTVPESPTRTTREKITDFLSMFRPVEGYFITPILLNINIVIFVLMVATGTNFFSPDNESLLKWGANFRPITLNGDWWRLLTCCFVHIGIIHIAFNMYALLYIGTLLEPLLGRSRFLTAYLLTGVTSSLASLWWNDFTVSAGASGAIFGMYGVFLALLTTKLLEEEARKALLSSVSIFIGYNLVIGFSTGIVDNAGHIGGLLGGVLIGYAYVPGLKNFRQVSVTYATIGMLCVSVFLLSFVAYTYLPNDIGKYSTRMDEFAVLEEKALKIYHLPKETPRDTVMALLKNQSLPGWRKNIQLLQDMEKLNLPESIKKRNKQLLQYSQLRLKRDEWYTKALEENTDVYNTQITQYDTQINAILSLLNQPQK